MIPLPSLADLARWLLIALALTLTAATTVAVGGWRLARMYIDARGDADYYMAVAEEQVGQCMAHADRVMRQGWYAASLLADVRAWQDDAARYAETMGEGQRVVSR